MAMRQTAEHGLLRSLLRFGCEDRGAAMLEATVVVPVLLILGLGIYEFGNLFYQRHLIVGGVRDAARYVAGMPFEPATVTAAKHIAIYGHPIDTSTYRTKLFDTGGSPDPLTFITIPLPGAAGAKAIDNSLSIYRGPASIPIVQVTAQVPYTSLGYFGVLAAMFPSLTFNAITITVSHEERHYGNR